MDDAEERYEEGKKLLQAADRLMAMVHAAKMQAEESDQSIKDLIKKAEHIHKQLSEVQKSLGGDFDSRSEKRQKFLDTKTQELTFQILPSLDLFFSAKKCL